MSEYRTYILDEKDLGLWDDYVIQSVGGTIFHRLEWLKAAADQSNMKFMPVAVTKGEDLVCLMPLFYKKKYGLRILLSPPNRCYVSYLGPVMNISSSNRYHYEWTYISILDEIIHFAEKQIGFDYFRIIHTPAIRDMRPYVWNGYSVEPKYTYIFNLAEGEKELYNRFHTTAKNKHKRAISNDTVSIVRDRNYAYELLSLAGKRSVDQKYTFRINIDYLKNLMNSSIVDKIEAVAAIQNGNTIAGSIYLMHRNSAYAWIATLNKDETIPGIGELILWEQIKYYRERGYKTFDLIDANIRRLCRHKSRYGADLVDYFEVSKTSLKGKIALGLMNKYKKRQND